MAKPVTILSMSEFNDSLRLTPEDMAGIQPDKQPKPLTPEEVISAQNEHSWRAVQPSEEQIATETDAAWLEHMLDELQSKLVESHLRLHAEKNKGQEVQISSSIDALTGLANKESFDIWLEEKIKRNPTELTIAFIDIDRFKQINDTYGHAVGDAVLQFFAKLIEHVVREDQDIAARRSGDEFFVGIDGASETRVHEIADAILETVNAIGVASDGRLVPAFGSRKGVQKIEISMGFVHYQPGMSSADLQDKADKLMYQAKQSGKNQYLFEGFDNDETETEEIN